MNYGERLRRDTMRRRRLYGGRGQTGTITSTKPVIYWDAANHKYTVKTPKHKEFNDEMKTLVETASYMGRDDSAWLFAERELDLVKTITAAKFGDFDFVPKPLEQGFSMKDNGKANDAALRLWRIAGRDASLKAFKSMVMQYHPDLNKATGSNNIMADLNVAWDQLKKELGW